MSTEFTISVNDFEGPLDLLLQLIEKRKFLVNDVSLAKVTDDYIAHINNLKGQQNESTLHMDSHFILVASTLLLIKSKSLLPTLEFTQEEEQDMNDLEHRLKLYQRTKELSRHIDERFNKKISHQKNFVNPTVIEFAPDKRTNTATLAQLALALLKALPKPDLKKEVVVQKVMSLRDMIDSLTKRVQANIKMSFNEFSQSKDKIHVIVGFLAMLELAKQGGISIEQEKRYGDIHMETKEVGVPRYND